METGVITSASVVLRGILHRMYAGKGKSFEYGVTELVFSTA
jgi:hypothetical protein